MEKVSTDQFFIKKNIPCLVQNRKILLHRRQNVPAPTRIGNTASRQQKVFALESVKVVLKTSVPNTKKKKNK